MLRTGSAVDELKGYIEAYLLGMGIELRKPFRCFSPDHADVHPSMSYCARRQTVHCFSCGVTYDLFDLIGLEYGISDFMGQMERVRQLFSGDRLAAAHGPAGELPMPAQRLQALRSLGEGGLEYFFSRGVTAESCSRYGLFVSGDRAYFPILEDGVCVGWCGRAVREDLSPRYRNSKGIMGLWNADLLLEDGKGRRLFVTEGVLDALCLEQLGERSVALCGSQNARKLLERCEVHHVAAGGWEFVACGDPDNAGGKMNKELIEGLEGLGIRCSILALEPSDGDVNALYLRDRVRLEQLVRESASHVGAVDYQRSSAAAGMVDFFDAADHRAERPALSTGFKELDRVLDGGLYPGLYVLGAVSSLGKTSLLLQVAEYIAEHSADVLFFSLEQSKYELIAKSLSRLTARGAPEGGEKAFTARQLLRGISPPDPAASRLLQLAREDYARMGARLFIREGLESIGVEQIRTAVKEHVGARGTAPVVVVDYLQILCPSDPRATDKQNTDRAVIGLKRLSRDFDVPVLAVSSFNRDNYRVAVSMEAFKESGAVEYSSDVLLGLQLQGVGAKDFDANAEKVREPRRVELVLLKNRNGIPYAKIPLRYYAKYGLFEEIGRRRK